MLSPVVRAAWPVVETIGDLEARATRGALQVRWTDAWTEETDRVLDALPALPNCPRDLYRELLKPTAAQKKHAMVLEGGEPIALLSLRRAARHWEPVAYQCLPGVVAPARDQAALARAIRALGLELRVPAGLQQADIAALQPSDHWAYECFKIDLNGDYEAYWRARKRQSRLRKALRESERLQRRVDTPGDLEWTVEQWRQQWKDDPNQEVAAAADRINFWGALSRREDSPLKLHTLALADGEECVGGLVVLCAGEVVLHQCISRAPGHSDSGTALNLFAVEWAKAAGYSTLDLGSGPYKRDWGPVGGQRYGAVFRPRVMSALSWACTY